MPAYHDHFGRVLSNSPSGPAPDRLDKLRPHDIPGAQPRVILKNYIHDALNVRDIEGAQPARLHPVSSSHPHTSMLVLRQPESEPRGQRYRDQEGQSEDPRFALPATIRRLRPARAGAGAGTEEQACRKLLRRFGPPSVSSTCGEARPPNSVTDERQHDPQS